MDDCRTITFRFRRFLILQTFLMGLFVLSVGFLRSISTYAWDVGASPLVVTIVAVLNAAFQHFALFLAVTFLCSRANFVLIATVFFGWAAVVSALDLLFGTGAFGDGHLFSYAFLFAACAIPLTTLFYALCLAKVRKNRELQIMTDISQYSMFDIGKFIVAAAFYFAVLARFKTSFDWHYLGQSYLAAISFPAFLLFPIALVFGVLPLGQPFRMLGYWGFASFLSAMFFTAIGVCRLLGLEVNMLTVLFWFALLAVCGLVQVGTMIWLVSYDSRSVRTVR